MGFFEILILAVALSMDAFAVALCKGLATPKVEIKHMAACGGWFGAFQALMPLIGYFLGVAFRDYIEAVDHWIAFALLVLLGLNMLKEALSKDNECSCTDASLAFSVMLTMAIATSIDALAVGITFAFLKVDVILAVTIIGITTFLFSAAGIKIGSVFGDKYKSKAEFFGGAVLICLGLKILIEHLFFGG